MENNITTEEVLKMIRQIKSTEEIKIGDVLILTDSRRGRIPIGSLWEMETKGNLVAASIAIIEDGEHWRPLLDEHKPKKHETQMGKEN